MPSSSANLSSLVEDVATAPQEENPEPSLVSPDCDDDIEQVPIGHHITETPVGAKRPPSLSSCSKCSQLSKTNRSLQKENEKCTYTKGIAS